MGAGRASTSSVLADSAAEGLGNAVQTTPRPLGRNRVEFPRARVFRPRRAKQNVVDLPLDVVTVRARGSTRRSFTSGASPMDVCRWSIVVGERTECSSVARVGADRFLVLVADVGQGGVGQCASVAFVIRVASAREMTAFENRFHRGSKRSSFCGCAQVNRVSRETEPCAPRRVALG